MDPATTLATLKQAIAALYAPQTTQRTRQEADAFLQAFVRSGFGACLEPCGALLDDPASSRAELLFAAHATHRTVRHCVFKPGAAQRPQRSHVVMDDATYARFRGRLAARAAGEGPGPLLTQHALALAAVFLKDEDPADVVARVVAALRGAALLETLRVLPEELDELSIKPQLRAARRAAFTTSAPAALAAALDHAAGAEALALRAAAPYVGRLETPCAAGDAFVAAALGTLAAPHADPDALEAAAACYRAAAERETRAGALAGAVASLGARAAAGGAPRHVDVAAAALVDICRAGAGGDVSRAALGALLRSFGPRSSLAVAAAVAEAWAVVADADAAPGFLVACCGRRSFRHVAYDDDAAGDDDDAVERDVLGDALRVAAVAARDRDGALLAVLATPEPLAALHVYRAVARTVGLSAPVFDGLLRTFARVAALPDGPDARPYAVSCCLAMSAAPDARFGDAAAHFLARSDAVVARFGAIALMHATETADARLPSDGALRLCRAVAAAPRAGEFRRPGQESVRTLATRALANAARKAGPDAVAALLGAALAAVDGAADAEGLAVALLNVAVVAAASPRGAADAAAPRAADALVALARAPEEEAEDDDDDDDSDADDDAVPASATTRAARAAAHVFAAVLSPGWTDAAPKRQRRCCDAAGGASDAVLEAATAAGLEAVSRGLRRPAAAAGCFLLELAVAAAPPARAPAVAAAALAGLDALAAGHVAEARPASRGGALGAALSLATRLLRRGAAAAVPLRLLHLARARRPRLFSRGSSRDAVAGARPAPRVAAERRRGGGAGAGLVPAGGRGVARAGAAAPPRRAAGRGPPVRAALGRRGRRARGAARGGGPVRGARARRRGGGRRRGPARGPGDDARGPRRRREGLQEAAEAGPRREAQGAALLSLVPYRRPHTALG